MTGTAGPLSTTSVVFDLDGTLVDSRLDFTRLRDEVRDLLAARGLAWPGASGREPALAELITWARQAGGEGPGSAYAAALARVVEAERAAEGARAMPGAAAALSLLRRDGAAVGVLTNNARAPSLAQLDRLGLGDKVDVVLARDDVPALKPDPRGLALCLMRLGGRPRAWYVGDSWIDAAAAQALGVPFVALGMEPAALAGRGLRPAAAHAATLAEAVRAVRAAGEGREKRWRDG
ncbi:MAG: HAD-IA family hydrolase [Firmicutes bacterium]|nr:HAD-IA family hydrolase [Bacillota bacterium]